MSEEDRVRKLAELKAYIEKRTHDLEQELLKLRSLGEVVDVALAEKSFRRVEVPKPKPEPVPPAPPAAQVAGAPTVQLTSIQTIPVKTTTGIALADIQVDRNEVRVTPRPDMRFDPNSPPLRAFLIGRILDLMQAKDRSALQAGQLTEDKILSYRVEQDGNVLRQIVIKNYGDEKRLQELRSAISWTFRRMHERLASLK